MKPRDEEQSTRIRVKQRESWEGVKGNLDESTALLNWVTSMRVLYSRKLGTG